MKLLLRIFWFLLLPTLLVGLPIYFVSQAIESYPSIAQSSRLTPSILKSAKQNINRIDFLALQQGQPSTISFDQKALDDLFQLLKTISPQLRSQAILQEKLLHIKMSYPIQAGKNGFINIETGISPNEKLTFNFLKIGAVNIPQWAIKPCIKFSLAPIFGWETANQLLMAIQHININQQQLTVTLQPAPTLWNNLITSGNASLPSTANLNAVKQYLSLLEKQYQSIHFQKRHSISQTIPLLFQLAASRASTSSAIAENQAVIIAMSIYFGDQRIKKLINLDVTPNTAFSQKARFNRRRDWVQHFVISAGLTLTANEILADAIGIAKEYQDANTFSGFSFTDLAADRAGIAFAKYVTRDEVTAQRVQNRLKTTFTEDWIFPKLKAVPEWLNQQTFSTKYHDHTSIEYQKVIDMIDQRIQNCKLYQH